MNKVIRRISLLLLAILCLTFGIRFASAEEINFPSEAGDKLSTHEIEYSKAGDKLSTHEIEFSEADDKLSTAEILELENDPSAQTPDEIDKEFSVDFDENEPSEVENDLSESDLSPTDLSQVDGETRAVIHAISTYEPIVSGVMDGSCMAEGMAMLEVDTGRVLAVKNPNKRLPMASTTKIVTAITVIEHCKCLDKVVTIPDEAVGVEGSSIYLSKGEQLSIRDLLYGLMLQSGNDCAVALAVTIGGSVENFAEMMNDTARCIGARNSHFVNPHGLHDDEHYTTAYDLALISAYAMKNPTFAEIVGTKSHKTTWKDHDYGRVIVNKNKLLSTFDGANGIKTGFTKKAGRCLVASAKRNDTTIVCVVLNCGPMFEECARLLSSAFDAIVPKVLEGGTMLAQVPVIGGTKKFVDVGVEDIVRYPLLSDEAKRLKFEFELPETVFAPVKKGERIGKIKIYLDNRLLFSEDLFTINSVEHENFPEWMGEY